MSDSAKTSGAPIPGGGGGTGGTEDRDLLPQPEGDRDVLFQAQMAIANAFLGYYKYGLAVIGGVLLVTLVYGLVSNYQREAQRDVHAKISAVEKDLTDPEDKVALAKAAGDLEKIAVEGDGTAAVMALLQAGQVFRAADKHEDAMRAFDKASALQPKGILGWAAASGLAAEKARTGDTDGAIAVYQKYTAGDGIEAQEALWSIAVLQESAGKKDEARQALTDLTTRFPTTFHAPDAARALQRLGP